MNTKQDKPRVRSRQPLGHRWHSWLCLLFLLFTLAACTGPVENVWLDAPGWKRGQLIGETGLSNPASLALDEQGRLYLLLVDAAQNGVRPRVAALDRTLSVLWQRPLDVEFSRVDLPRIVWDGERLQLFWLSDGNLYSAAMDTSGAVVSTPDPLVAEGELDSYDVSVGDRGRISLWYAGSRREPGLYALRLDGDASQPVLVDEEGIEPRVRYDHDGNLHALWIRYPLGASQSVFYYGSYPQGEAEPGRQTEVAAPSISLTSTFQGPYFGIDEAHAYVFWSVLVRTGPQAGASETNFVSLPLGQPAQATRPQPLFVPSSSDLPYESAEETPLRAGPRVPLTGAGGSVPLGLESNPFVARELVVAARASIAFELRRQATQATLLYFRDGRPTAYQLLNFSPSSTGSPYVRSDDAGYLYATWLERAEERGFLVYLGSTAPDVLDTLDRLTLPDVGRMAAETIFGMLAGAALSPFVGILWLIGPLLALGLTSFLRRESEGTIAAGSLLSLVLALVIYWAVKLSTLPGATDYVPFSASIPIVPQWMEAPLRWGVMLTIMIVSLLTAWHFTYRRKTQSALYFLLIYVGVDSVLSLAIYGSIIFGFI